MNNVSEKQQAAKQSFLDKQQADMLITYQNADRGERNAVIRQINGFLSVLSQEQKLFWLQFRRKLERLNESAIMFSLGEVYLTIGAQDALKKSNQTADEFLARHQSGDWGNVCQNDAKENELSLKEGFRILSAYKTSKGEKLWCITEACRSSTTILLPEEY